MTFERANIQRMFGPGNPTDGLNLNQHYNSIAYAKSGEVLIASSQNSPYVSLYVPWQQSQGTAIAVFTRVKRWFWKVIDPLYCPG